MKKHWKGNRSKEQSSKISNIFIWGIIIVLMILGMTSCGKKDEEVKPEQPPNCSKGSGQYCDRTSQP